MLAGVQVEELSVGTLARLGLPGDTQGVVVARRWTRAAPPPNKLRPGDVIDKINQQAVATPAQYAALLGGVARG